MHWGTMELSEENTFEAAYRFQKATLDAGYQDDTILPLPSVGGTVALNVLETDRQLEATGT